MRERESAFLRARKKVRETARERGEREKTRNTRTHTSNDLCVRVVH